MSEIRREQFARKLCALYDRFNDKDFDERQYDREIMQAFIDFAGDTPFFRKCTETIEFGSDVDNIEPDNMEYGLMDKPIRKRLIQEGYRYP